jgi:hypothetical protein
MPDDLIRRAGDFSPLQNETPTEAANKTIANSQHSIPGGFESEDAVESGIGGQYIFSAPIIGSAIGEAIGGAVSDGDADRAAESKKNVNLEGLLNELGSQDKLGNFEIQNLMSQFNQAETLRGNFKTALQHFESESRLGNFKSQRLLSSFNQSERSPFESALKDLQSQDKLGNFEIQDLMSQFNHMENLKQSFESALKSLESQDRLGNFEIQDLMSLYNQAETLSSSTARKENDDGNDFKI